MGIEAAVHPPWNTSKDWGLQESWTATGSLPEIGVSLSRQMWTFRSPWVRGFKSGEAGMTVVFFGGTARDRFLIFGDSLRTSAGEFVAGLQSRGRKVLLLSGDGENTTAAVAAALGIEEFAEVFCLLRRRKRSGSCGAGTQGLYVGDGVNDA